MAKYWIAVASKEHVKEGVEESFAQVCHGKGGPLKWMDEGDWIVYYSPTIKFGEKEPCQSFTAIGRMKPGSPYEFTMSPGFIPWRRKVEYFKSVDAPILPLIDKLSFITDKQKWGFPFRKGCFAISSLDFQVISRAMGVTN